jgi:pyruvate/2-oxoglutarate/acetoin dehydrogenase E1 component/TPP-dependent pyruvate/acetoin dehydrogenase alpha subunit
MAKVAPRRPSGKTEVVTPAGTTLSAREVIQDYRLAYRSRIASVIGRREVLTGKAGFGIFGDGKEIPQLAMAKAFREGDWRAGYYRDQTFMFGTEMSTLDEFFAQLYANPDVGAEPASGGRQMPSHFATRVLDERGRWKPQVRSRNSSSDMSSVGGQMARLLGLAYASKLYRQNLALRDVGRDFSVEGNEVAFGTIGDAGTSEGIFWETINAAAVLQVPLVMSVWDDGYGISVPREYQTAKSSISAALAGMCRDGGPGLEIYVVKGWEYLALCDTYLAAVERTRATHVPALIHVIEVTQPQGHSTSGSHERYKTRERLAWEDEYDGIRRMREWIIREGIATGQDLDALEDEDKRFVEERREAAWEAYQAPVRRERDEAVALLRHAAEDEPSADLEDLARELEAATDVTRRLVQATLARAELATRGAPAATELRTFLEDYRARNAERYTSHLYSASAESPLAVPEEKPRYTERSESADGRLVLLRCFDENFARDPRIFVIGEDVGKLGDVNLVFEGLQAKYGELRLTDTGIREATILGQGIGAALRGLRPIVDIQYVDYLLFALQTLSDDLATLHYRTHGGQKAPVVIRTKGHRLQGIWHTGSPMSLILSSCRGVYLCVPRDMTRAAGMYNTLFRGDNPGIVIEVLNGYRIKERVPENVGTFTVAFGMPEVIREGASLTVVTYGALCRIALSAADALAPHGIDLEVIDVQTLEPFDLTGSIARSVEKTNAVLFLDEDVPGGASAYMMQRVLETQGAWDYLDAAPRTLCAAANRSPYGTDGEYFTKPNAEDVVRVAYDMMRERDPRAFPALS